MEQEKEVSQKTVYLDLFSTLIHQSTFSFFSLFLISLIYVSYLNRSKKVNQSNGTRKRENFFAKFPYFFPRKRRDSTKKKKSFAFHWRFQNTFLFIGKKNKMENKELQMERRKIAEKAAFISWAMTNQSPISNVTHSQDQFTNWDVCFTSGQTHNKVVCEMKARKSKFVYNSQMIEKYKWDFLLSLNQARPELAPIYLVFYNTISRQEAGEFDLRYVTPPQWVLEYHWEDEKRLRKVPKWVGYLKNDDATWRTL